MVISVLRPTSSTCSSACSAGPESRIQRCASTARSWIRCSIGDSSRSLVALRPADKRNSRFLSRLQIALDDDLARIPLDGRPAPRAFATRTVRGATAQGVAFSRKVVQKGRQRLMHDRRPPAGGIALAIEGRRPLATRTRTSSSTSVLEVSSIRTGYREMLGGRVEPRPSDGRVHGQPVGRRTGPSTLTPAYPKAGVTSGACSHDLDGVMVRITCNLGWRS